MHQPKTVQNLGPWSEMFLLFLTHETHYLASLTLPWSGLIMWSVFSSMEMVSFDTPSISHLNIICWLKQIPQVGEITIYLIYCIWSFPSRRGNTPNIPIQSSWTMTTARPPTPHARHTAHWSDPGVGTPSPGPILGGKRMAWKPPQIQQFVQYEPLWTNEICGFMVISGHLTN